jgi:Spy/CpxP family protein refolding chaperone
MKIHKLGLMAALAAAALAFSPALNAQEKKEGKRQGPPTAAQREDMLKQRMTRMSEELKLTDAQKPKVEAVLKDQAEKMRGLRDATPEVRREKAQALRTDMDKKMKEVLTADQYTSWQKMRAQGREGRGGPGGEKKRGEKNAEKTEKN